MAFWNSFVGQCQVELVSSDLSQMLTAINTIDLPIQDVEVVDELHMRAIISRSKLPELEHLISSRGEEIYIKSRVGVFWKLKSLSKRPVLVCGVVFLFLLCMFLPSRILFFQVTGNKIIPEKYIIEMAKECGLDFFTPRRGVRSEKIKNALLSAIPQLQWVGVNTNGCVATITVRERDAQSNEDTASTANSIVAGRDGIVQEITVFSGTPLCKVGQGVKAGDVLVSGYTDCGLVIKLKQAEAEVFAYTFRDLEAVTPINVLKRTLTTRKKRKIMLQLGKNIINLWKDSGISDTRCVKMYEEKYLTLPGGFQLPVALLTETSLDCYLQDDVTDQPDWFDVSADKFLIGNMIAGKILSKEGALSNEDELYVFNGRYMCLEMIGQKRYEENLIKNGT